MNVIIRQIVEYLPNINQQNAKLSFPIRNDSGIGMSIDGKHIFINYDDTWELVKLKIDKRFNERDENCPICCDTDMMSMSISCSKCTTRICLPCFGILAIKNHGKIICSICRDEQGEQLNPPEIQELVGQLMNSITNKKYMLVFKQRILEFMDTSIQFKCQCH